MTSRTSIFLPTAWLLVLSWIAYATWLAGQSGRDEAVILSAIFALFSFAKLMEIHKLVDRRWQHRKLEKAVKTAGKDQGQAIWATPKQLKSAGLFNKEGLFIGRLQKKDLWYSGENHLFTIAPPGTGKSTSLVIPNLLTSNRSMIVTDPKGELYAVTHRFRRDHLGQRIIVLCPWAEKMSQELGIEIPDHGLNPLSFIRSGYDAKDDAELLSTLLLPGKANMSSSDEFWNDGGQSLLSALVLLSLDQSGSCDLPMIRHALMASPEKLFDTLCSMEESLAYEGALSQMGGKLLGTLKNAPAQFEGALGTAQKALRIYDFFGPMGKHVSSGEIDFGSFKSVPTTLYLIMPSDRTHTHAEWLNMVISLAIEAIARDRSNKKVLFLLDEFANLGYLPNVLRGMAQYRGQGIMCWPIIQQISQLSRIYGREGLKEFLSMAEVINVFGAREPDTLKLFSELMGQRTVRNFSQHMSPAQAGGKFNYNYNASDVGVPLMRPEDIRTMPANEQLIYYSNLPPIRANKVSYLDHRQWRKNADSNPYYK